MREDSLLRLFQFIITYPLFILSFIGFAVMHHRSTNRLRCYGFFRNLLYTAACMVVATALFFIGVLLVRYAVMSSIQSSQLVIGFAFSGIVVAARRIIVGTKPQTPKTLS